MKIVSWNVNGIRAVLKKDFAESVNTLSADILCLQESKAQDNEVMTALDSINGYHIYCNSAERKGYSGTILLSKIEPLQVTYDIGIEEHDQEGRVICAEYNDFYLVNVYVPNSGQGLKRLDYRKTWDHDFLEYLKNLQQKKPVILCGDLNVAHQAIDLKNDKSNYNKTAGYTQVEIDGMDDKINAGFVDVFRNKYPEEIAYTYWSYRFNARAKNVGWRIDYFLVSELLINKISDIKILSEIFGSDHCPVSLEIDF